jgi:hypothetical protein
VAASTSSGTPGERLTRTRALLEQEVAHLQREEEYLSRQIRRAEEQVRYYNQLLADFKQSSGRAAPLHDFARRLG